ncbi:hypothetical protein B5J94_12840, partial [Moraxella lacunata]
PLWLLIMGFCFRYYNTRGELQFALDKPITYIKLRVGRWVYLPIKSVKALHFYKKICYTHAFIFP